MIVKNTLRVIFGRASYTILELLVTIIIVGVVAMLALPKLTDVVEASRRAEAVAMFSPIREEFERCYNFTGTYKWCQNKIKWSNYNGPNNLFQITGWHQTGGTTFSIMAVRKELECGQSEGSIVYHHGTEEIIMCGTGPYVNVGEPWPECEAFSKDPSEEE